MWAKRCFDLVSACMALFCLWPVLLAAALGIKLSDPGPVFYRAQRMGRGNRPFTMYKLRTMRVVQAQKSAITAQNDDRVFGFGNLLRRLKIDELPQLLNVLSGEMSIVGPRPEAVSIVASCYREPHLETLAIAPGLTSPGSLFYYTHGEHLVGKEDPERDYAEHLLAPKLALDLDYVRNHSLVGDLVLILRTIYVIGAMALGKKAFPYPVGYQAIMDQHLYPISYSG